MNVYVRNNADQSNQVKINLVERIAHKVKSELVDLVDIDDLIQTGMIGLLEAQLKYDPKFGASFDTYAGIRIRGAMLDSIRANDYVSREVRKKSREINEAMQNIQNRKLSPATDKEIANEMGINLCDYVKIVAKAACKYIHYEEAEQNYMNNVYFVDDKNNPEMAYISTELKYRLGEVYKTLPDNMKVLLRLHYVEDRSLKEVGQLLGVTASRCSQIHREMLNRLQNKFMNYSDNVHNDASCQQDWQQVA